MKNRYFVIIILMLTLLTEIVIIPPNVFAEDDVQNLIFKAKASAKYGEIQDEFNFYLGALKLDPNNVEAQKGKEYTSSQIQSLEESISKSDQILKNNPNNETGLVEKALALFSLGKTAEASKVADILVKNPSSDLLSLNNRYNLFVLLNKNDEALAILDKLISFSASQPNSAYLLYQKSIILYKLGQYQNSSDLLDEWIKNFQNSPNNKLIYYIFKEIISEKLGKNDDAKTWPDLYHQIDPNEQYMINYKSLILFQIGAYNELNEYLDSLPANTTLNEQVSEMKVVAYDRMVKSTSVPEFEIAPLVLIFAISIIIAHSTKVAKRMLIKI